MVKKLLFFTFLIIIFLSAFITVPTLKLLRNEFKKEANILVKNNSIKDSELTKFDSAQLKNVRWIGDKEFVNNSTLYDIVKIKIINGRKIYFCYKDIKEQKVTEIEASIEKFNRRYCKVLFSNHPIKIKKTSHKFWFFELPEGFYIPFFPKNSNHFILHQKLFFLILTDCFIPPEFNC